MKFLIAVIFGWLIIFNGPPAYSREAQFLCTDGTGRDYRDSHFPNAQLTCNPEIRREFTADYACVIVEQREDGLVQAKITTDALYFRKFFLPVPDATNVGKGFKLTGFSTLLLHRTNFVEFEMRNADEGTFNIEHRMYAGGEDEALDGVKYCQISEVSFSSCRRVPTCK